MTVGRIPVIEGGIQPTIFDAKADLLTATANDTPARLAVGTNGQVLTADSTAGTGLKWAAGGKVLQVVQDTLTSAYTNSTGTYSDVGLTVSITPSSASSKIMIFVGMPYVYTSNTIATNNNYSAVKLLRDATQLQTTDFGFEGAAASAAATTFYTAISYSYLDSPATTSSLTYKIQGKVSSASTMSVYATASIISSIVVMEIGA
jgi:hypothetical protein